MADVALVLVTIVFFAVIAFVAKRAARRTQASSDERGADS